MFKLALILLGLVLLTVAFSPWNIWNRYQENVGAKHQIQTPKCVPKWNLHREYNFAAIKELTDNWNIDVYGKCTGYRKAVGCEWHQDWHQNVWIDNGTAILTVNDTDYRENFQVEMRSKMKFSVHNLFVIQFAAQFRSNVHACIKLINRNYFIEIGCFISPSNLPHFALYYKNGEMNYEKWFGHRFTVANKYGFNQFGVEYVDQALLRFYLNGEAINFDVRDLQKVLNKSEFQIQIQMEVNQFVERSICPPALLVDYVKTFSVNKDKKPKCSQTTALKEYKSEHMELVGRCRSNSPLKSTTPKINPDAQSKEKSNQTNLKSALQTAIVCMFFALFILLLLAVMWQLNIAQTNSNTQPNHQPKPPTPKHNQPIAESIYGLIKFFIRVLFGKRR